MSSRKFVPVLLVILLAIGPAARADHPGDRTGVTDTTLTIGLHASLTGAVPIHPSAVREGKDLYWRWLKEIKGDTVHGRDVEVLFANDEYTPETAVTVCHQMAEEGAFLLAGFSGPEQNSACAEYASPRGIPYVAPGSQEAGVAGLGSHFALSATHVAQAPIMANFVTTRLTPAADQHGIGSNQADGTVRVGLVRQNTSYYDEAADSLRDALRAAGSDLHEEYSVVKEGASGEAATIASQAQRDGVDVLISSISPTFTVRLAHAMDTNTYQPRLLLYGMGGGLDGVARAACGEGAAAAFHGASALSPWPAWSDAASFDFDFITAAARFAPDLDVAGRGDVLFALWGMMKSIHAILEAAGPDPVRSDLLATLDAGHASASGVWPPLEFSAADHFGADAVHRIEADCTLSEPRFIERDAFLTGVGGLDTFITGSPPSITAEPQAAFTFEADEMATFECSLDDAVFEACTSPVSYVLGDGWHLFQVRARGPGGALDPTPAQRRWLVDTAPPTITYSGRTPPNEYGWNNTSVTADWACTDSLSGPRSESVTAFLDAQGDDLEITGRCLDRAGNEAIDTRTGIRIDQAAPTVRIDQLELATDIAGVAGDALSGLGGDDIATPFPVSVTLTDLLGVSPPGWEARPARCVGQCAPGAKDIRWSLARTPDLQGVFLATAHAVDRAGNVGNSERAVLIFL